MPVRSNQTTQGSWKSTEKLISERTRTKRRERINRTLCKRRIQRSVINFRVLTFFLKAFFSAKKQRFLLASIKSSCCCNKQQHLRSEIYFSASSAVNINGVKRTRAIRKECFKLTCSVTPRPLYRNSSQETEEDKQLVWHSEAAPLFSHTHRVSMRHMFDITVEILQLRCSILMSYGASQKPRNRVSKLNDTHSLMRDGWMDEKGECIPCALFVWS